jgi:hypothetical protein
MRQLVVRFELGEGLHIYGAPVPDGMIATEVSLSGAPGLTVLDPILPPTETLHLAGMDVDLEVWSGTVDIALPFYPKGELASETRPLDAEETEIEVQVRYQACTDSECLLPRTEAFKLALAFDVIDVPALSMHVGHGQREGNYDSMPGARRLMLRKLRKHPVGLPKYMFKMLMLELAARKRAWAAR